MKTYTITLRIPDFIINKMKEIGIAEEHYADVYESFVLGKMGSGHEYGYWENISFVEWVRVSDNIVDFIENKFA